MPMTRDELLYQQASLRTYQARADDAFASWGFRAPEPIIGKSEDAYRRRLMIKAKYQLPDDHELRSVRIKRLQPDAVNAYWDQFFDACKAAASRPDAAPPGQLEARPWVDPETGQKWTKFYGQENFVKQMGIPGRRVVGFRTDQGFMNTNGRFLR